jgi:dienelactone hydrolase
MSSQDLDGFERATFTHDGKERTIFRQGSGPAVIVIAEMPGISPKVLEFARRVVAIGCTAVLPHLFGVPGKDADPSRGSRFGTLRYGLSSIVPACISREFTVLATGKTSPVVAWLRALAASEHERCGGPGVGAVGMCFTGGYALAMATDDRLLVPVLSQPSMPIPVTKARRRSIDCSPADLDIVKGRCAAQGLEVIGLRFTTDRFVPAERFQFLRDELGDAFIAVELPGEAAKAGTGMPAHSVLTEHLIDAEGEPTRDALDLVLDHFRRKLLAGPPERDAVVEAAPVAEPEPRSEPESPAEPEGAAAPAPLRASTKKATAKPARTAKPVTKAASTPAKKATRSAPAPEAGAAPSQRTKKAAKSAAKKTAKQTTKKTTVKPPTTSD